MPKRRRLRASAKEERKAGDDVSADGCLIKRATGRKLPKMFCGRYQSSAGNRIVDSCSGQRRRTRDLTEEEVANSNPVASNPQSSKSIARKTVIAA